MEHKKILVVDDDENMCFLLGDMIALLGYNVKLAYSGREAKKVIEEGEIDAIVTDTHMPKEEGGVYITKIILEGNYKLVTLVTSNHAPNHDDEVQRAVENAKSINGRLGICMCPYIEKPFSQKGIKETLDKAFGNSAGETI